MFNSIKEAHAAIHAMNQEELDQMTRGVGMLYENGEIDQDHAIEALGVIVARTWELKLKKSI